MELRHQLERRQRLEQPRPLVPEARQWQLEQALVQGPEREHCLHLYSRHRKELR